MKIRPGDVEIESDESESEAGPPGHRDRRGFIGFVSELPVLVVLALVVALVLKTFFVQAFFIPSKSMQNTLQPGDRVLVNKLSTHFGPPSYGDIVVFSDPHPTPEPHRNVVQGFVHWLGDGLGFSTPANEDFIKRVIGLPGDTIQVKNGVTYRNGAALDEPYLKPMSPELRRGMDAFGPYTVPAGHLFVMGDNRLNSDDSRYDLGPVPIDDVIGKAFVRIWPPSRLSILH